MGIDASAVARVVGVEATFQDLRGGSVLYLPQRIAVIGQGSSDVVYASTKRTVLTAGEAGTVYGFGSPIHSALRELKPANGDGVNTIPVTVYPLADHGSGVAAAGTIVPSGTHLAPGAYRISIGGVLSEQFVILAGDTVTARYRKMGTAINAVLEMPMKAGYTYSTITASALTGTGNGTLTALSAPATPKPGDWNLTLLTAVGNGGVWRITDPDGAVVSSSLTMTPGVGAATVFNVGGLQFTITDGTTDFGVGATFTITVPVTAMPLTAKWKGESGNDLKISVIGDMALGTIFTITQPSGGLVNPSVAAALAQIGNVWETMILNLLNVEDTVALNAIQTFGEGRYGVTVKKPLLAFVGNTKASWSDATAISNTRRTDRINGQLVAPGSVNLPCVVAARELARMVVIANNNPPTDYAGQQATNLTPGADADQWDWPTRDAALKAGSSTIEVIDGVVNMSDTVMFYRPTGEEPPAYRYVCDIVKVHNIIYNLNLIFASSKWNGMVLIPDDQATKNKNARRPKQAKADIAAMVDSLALEAIISDPAFAKSTIYAVIDSLNPKRLNVGLTVKISGNVGIIDCALSWGFYFGGVAAAA